MNKPFIKDSLGWGFILWFIGYILGFVFFTLVPPAYLGWAIMPFGIAITLWVLFRKVKGDSMKYYLSIAVAWTLIAVVCDYLFLVMLLKPADGYYKLDVYIYYVLAFLMPLAVGYYGLSKKKT